MGYQQGGYYPSVQVRNSGQNQSYSQDTSGRYAPPRAASPGRAPHGGDLNSERTRWNDAPASPMEQERQTVVRFMEPQKSTK